MNSQQLRATNHPEPRRTPHVAPRATIAPKLPEGRRQRKSLIVADNNPLKPVSFGIWTNLSAIEAGHNSGASSSSPSFIDATYAMR
jgi:hypothetical protein